MSSSSTTSSTGTVRVKRSRTRRAGESMFGMLLLTRNIVLILGSLLLLVAGGWTSWETAGPALTSDVRGTVRIAKCTEEECAGTFFSTSKDGAQAQKVTIAESASGKVGERLQVALRPGTKEAVRTGPSGALYGSVPFGGSLVLAGLVFAMGMRMKRTGLVLGVLGIAVMGASWAVLTF
ncbi:hypothetical protein G4Z16_20935 [Streptomyces bathyalis]|uniref:Uncharacterized protein n=1 Tax=Streptomyces bathyalis TaxID=2710756 RepID=A0A7T1WTD1_9ACTN|nr:hypothetical protein [Streptomyces bathyalis]QPP08454.1 hypothetical protein G4Z16_20935 [Streptomyces bathyalis]